MEDSIRGRLAEELAANGLGFSEVSLRAKWPNGKPLGKTYARDVIKRGKGRHEGVEAICNGSGLNWPRVKTGNRGNGAEPEAAHYSAVRARLLPASHETLQALIAERRELVARKHAVEEAIASLVDEME